MLHIKTKSRSIANFCDFCDYFNPLRAKYVNIFHGKFRLFRFWSWWVPRIYMAPIHAPKSSLTYINT